MLDALELGLSIAKGCKEGWHASLDDAVAEYEAHMCVIAGKAAKESYVNQKMGLGENGAQKFADKIRHFKASLDAERS